MFGLVWLRVTVNLIDHVTAIRPSSYNKFAQRLRFGHERYKNQLFSLELCGYSNVPKPGYVHFCRNKVVLFVVHHESNRLRE